MTRPLIRRLDLSGGSVDRSIPELHERPSVLLDDKFVFVATNECGVVGLLAVAASGAFATVAASDHFVAPEADTEVVYGELYREAAQACLALGAYIHDVEVLSSSPAETAFFNLGFGRRTCIATTNVHTEAPEPGVLTTRTAGIADLDTIAMLSAQESSYRTESPVFADHGPVVAAEVRAYHARLLGGAATHLVAQLDGEAVGLITIEWTNSFKGLLDPAMPLIGSTFVAPGHRGRGIAASLVNAAMNQLVAGGHESVSVTFNTSNLLSRSFWLSVGFSPVGWKLARRIPQRYLLK